MAEGAEADRIGFIGLGAMGGPMARRLCERQFRVVACDSAPGALDAAVGHGATAVGTPAEVAAQASVVLCSLPTPDVVRQVALGADGIVHGGIGSGGAARVFVDLSTTGPSVARAVAAGLAERGITAIDAPVSGGVAGANAGTLAIMVSGDAGAIEAARPALEAIGRVFVVGDQVGLGQVLKLINNGLAATSLIASVEAVAMGVKSGLDPRMIVDVIGASSGQNFMMQKVVAERVLTRAFDFGFRTELMHKDIRLCTDEADVAGVPMFVTNAARQIWSLAMAQGMGKDDISTLARLLEGWAGTEIKPKS
jgi:3-hydroxyisobutyrate dehydrogenase-like beta-hydroxyacid dehydrogenase